MRRPKVRPFPQADADGGLRVQSPDGPSRWAVTGGQLSSADSLEAMSETLSVRALAASVVIALSAFGMVACGTSDATEGHASARTFQVSGSVARVCPGPIIVGRAPRCSNVAVFTRAGDRWSVHGHFTIRLAPGAYEVTIDNCADKQRVAVMHRISGLKLVPHCAVPL